MRKEHIMNNWSVVVHHAAARHYRLGCEDTTLRVHSSVHMDNGISAVIRESHEDPAAYPLQTACTPARLLALLRQIAARLLAIAGHSSAVSK
jgi:hypothetical protein